MFVFWYCHKRGREVRLAREAEEAGGKILLRSLLRAKLYVSRHLLISCPMIVGDGEEVLEVEVSDEDEELEGEVTELEKEIEVRIP
jgi:riboflavin biosynthesis pyrimidine reductase